MRKAVLLVSLATGIALAGCGKKEMLKAADNRPLPPKPATSPVQPTPTRLLTRDSQELPSRFEEALTNSTELQSSRFDMPPPG